MLTVLLGYFKKNYDTWVAAVLVEVMASASLTLALGLTIAGAASGGAVQEEYSSIGGIQIGFTAVAGIACIAVIIRMVIGMSRAEIAQWQLAGGVDEKNRHTDLDDGFCVRNSRLCPRCCFRMGCVETLR